MVPPACDSIDEWSIANTFSFAELCIIRESGIENCSLYFLFIQRHNAPDGSFLLPIEKACNKIEFHDVVFKPLFLQ
ncbi:MAG: hypothetical protein HUU45_13345 [Leptospiraceae bacterium]|nr:hypothetical protein [Leptospiraceae bacterium]